MEKIFCWVMGQQSEMDPFTLSSVVPAWAEEGSGPSSPCLVQGAAA